MGKQSEDKSSIQLINPVPGASDALHRLAFDSSLQANIISNAASGQILLVNQAACQLLGYTQKQLLSLNRSAIFDTSETSFRKMIRERTADGQAAAVVTAVRKNGKLLTCQVTSAVFTDEEIEKAIITITDLSPSLLRQQNIDTKKEKVVAANIIVAKAKQAKIDIKRDKIVASDIVIAQAKSEARLAENNAWIKYIAKTSYDVMWDWDIASGEIYVGDSIAEVFGYKVQNNTVSFKEFTACLLPEERKKVEDKLFKDLASTNKTWSDSFMFRQHDGAVAFTTSRASIVRDEALKPLHLIGAIQDVSRLHELQYQLDEKGAATQRDLTYSPSNDPLSFDVIWHRNLQTNEVFIGGNCEALFGNTSKDDRQPSPHWGNRIHPDDQPAVEETITEALRSSVLQWQHTYRFIRADGSEARVLDKASIFRDAQGKAYKMIGVMQDLAKQRTPGTSFPSPLEDRKSSLIKKIKDVIIQLVHHSDQQVQINYSQYLSTQLKYDYTYLANVFSESEGMPIQKFIIIQKLKRVQELILSGRLNLTEIALKLHYSSVAHLSHQFKKVTGLTPSQFKEGKIRSSSHMKKV
ncbi:MAG: PAS domain-containing protein [Chitinophagaceae bacterium]